MQPDVVTMAAQFGMAGLIAWMWLSERRGAQQREAELRESHGALRRQGLTVEQLVKVVTDNTRALTALEESQRRLVGLLDRMGERGETRREGS